MKKKGKTTSIVYYEITIVSWIPSHLFASSPAPAGRISFPHFLFTDNSSLDSPKRIYSIERHFNRSCRSISDEHSCRLALECSSVLAMHARERGVLGPCTRNAVGHSCPLYYPLHFTTQTLSFTANETKTLGAIQKEEENRHLYFNTIKISNEFLD